MPKSNRYPTACMLDQLSSSGLWAPGEELRLHLGCGENHLEGYVNIDYPPSEHSIQERVTADICTDISTLSFPSETIDEIRLHHVFEHFSRSKALALLIRWHAWLKMGGLLHLETPDMEGSVKSLSKELPYQTRQAILRHVFGSQEADWAYHLDGWDKDKYCHILSLFGFSVECKNVQWNAEPWLSNVHAFATKRNQIAYDDLLKIADDILLDSIVANVPAELKMHRVWCRMLRDELARCAAGDQVASEHCYVSVVNESDGAETMGYDEINADRNGEFALLAQVIRKGQIIFDVGANKGTWSKKVLSCDGDVSVFAFEPVPGTFDFLRASVVSKHARLFNVAISDSDDEKTLYHYCNSSEIEELSSLYRRPEVEKSLHLAVEAIRVQCRTIDSFCRQHQINVIDFLKIDTEGGEFDVLSGAKTMLSDRKIRLIQFEYGGTYVDAKITLQQMFTMLSHYGFSIFRITAEGIIHIERWRESLENYRYSNYFAALGSLDELGIDIQTHQPMPFLVLTGMWSPGGANTDAISQQDGVSVTNLLVRDKVDAATGLMFSKDRAMQLDATLRSWFLHCKDPEAAKLTVLYTTSSGDHEKQYQQLVLEYPTARFVRERDFRNDVLTALRPSAHVLFMVDDNLFVRDFKLGAAKELLSRTQQAIGFSLRLGSNTTYCYMLGKQQSVPPCTTLGDDLVSFDWTASEYDFAYPLELSSSLYRVGDLLPLLERLQFKNPNTLELVLAENASAFRNSKPILLSFSTSVAFCNPVNMVQSMWKNKAGGNAEYSSAKLADMFRAGKRIDVQKLSGHVPDACHQEVPLSFVEEDCDRMSPTSLPAAQPVASIGIPSLNGLHHIKPCLDSIRRHTPAECEVFVIDNGSTDGSLEYLRAQSDITLIEIPQNIGPAGARNKFLALAQGAMIIFLDNDTLVTEGWIAKYAGHMKADPNVGIIGACTNYASGLQGIPNARYKDIVGLDEYALKREHDFKGVLVDSPRLISFCVCVRQTVIEKIGAMETRFSITGFEDDDYSLRVTIAGYRSVIAQDIFIHHTGGPQGRGDVQYNSWLLEAWNGFKRKWGLRDNLQFGEGYDVSQLVSQRFEKRTHFLPLPNRSAVEALIHHRASDTHGITSEQVEEWFALALSCIRWGNDSAALEHLGRVKQELDNRDGGIGEVSRFDVLMRQGDCSLRLERLQDAREHYEEALRDNPQSAQACFGLGVCFQQAGLVEAARQMFEAALSLNPELEQARSNILECVEPAIHEAEG